MKASKEYLKQFQTEKQWKVRSKSDPEKFYIVKLLKSGKWECECIGFDMNKKKPKTCRHIRIISHKLQREKYDLVIKGDLNDTNDSND